jgi:5-methylcytosine-specific restriction endonuclease McrA
MRICSGVGCLRKVAEDVRYCAECQAAWIAAKPIDDGIRKHGRITEQTIATADRDIYAFLYSSKRWQRLRADVIRRHPLCDRCGLKPSEIIDHVIPAGVVIVQAKTSRLYLVDSYAGFFFRSNLQGLCRVCHGHKTEEDKAHDGAWPDAVAKERGATRRTWSF